MSNQDSPSTKKCAKCNASFECLHNEKCWCMEYSTSKENLDYLKATYDNCLCPECLRAYTQ